MISNARCISWLQKRHSPINSEPSRKIAVTKIHDHSLNAIQQSCGELLHWRLLPLVTPRFARCARRPRRNNNLRPLLTYAVIPSEPGPPASPSLARWGGGARDLLLYLTKVEQL